MTNGAKKLSASLLIAVTSCLLLGGTAYAMDFNDDADLDTTALRDLSGCTNPDPEICDWSDAKYQRAQRKQQQYAKNHPETHGIPRERH